MALTSPRQIMRGAAERVLVYGAGFLVVFVMTRALPPEEFGRFSVIQSVLEVAAIFATGGVGLVITSETLRVGRQSVLQYFLATFWLALAAAGMIVAWGSFSATMSPLLIGQIALLMIGGYCWTMLSYTVRGLGHASVFNVEPALRSILIAACIIFLYFFSGRISLFAALNVYIFSYGASIVFLSFLAFQLPSEPHDSLSFKILSLSITSGCFSFLSKKADILILSPFLTSTVIGSYKIAFIFSELPLQITMALLVHSQSHFRDDDNIALSKKAYLNILLSSFLITIPMLPVVYFVNYYIFPKYSFFPVYTFMWIYYFIKIVQFPYEFMLSSRRSFFRLAWANAGSFTAKIVVFPSAIYLLGDHWYVVFPLLALVEFALWEWILKSALGWTPASWLVPIRRTT